MKIQTLAILLALSGCEQRQAAPPKKPFCTVSRMSDGSYTARLDQNGDGSRTILGVGLDEPGNVVWCQQELKDDNDNPPVVVWRSP